MKEVPILFNTEMVQAIQGGIKTQTRRPVKYQPREHAESPKLLHDGTWQFHYDAPNKYKAPWKIGDVLWVRERARLVDFGFDKQRNFSKCTGNDSYAKFRYEADQGRSDWIKIPDRIKPIKLGNCCPNGCFRELARTFLKVNRVWCERVQDISEEDAKSEGVHFLCECGGEVDINDPESHWACEADDGMIANYKNGFVRIWDSIYGNWNDNPWAWCCEFELIK